VITSHISGHRTTRRPRAYRPLCRLAADSRCARESAHVVYRLRRGVTAGETPPPGAVVFSLASCAVLAICLCHVQAPERPFRIILCQQGSSLFQRRFSAVERALRRRESALLAPTALPGALLGGRHQYTSPVSPRRTSASLARCAPHLALGRVLTRLRQHGIDLFALLKPLR